MSSEAIKGLPTGRTIRLECAEDGLGFCLPRATGTTKTIGFEESVIPNEPGCIHSRRFRIEYSNGYVVEGKYYKKVATDREPERAES